MPDDSPGGEGRGTLPLPKSRTHQLNNLFQVIVGSLELLRRARELPREAAADAVETALRATQEASLLAQELLGERAAAAPPPYEPRDSASSSAAANDTGRPKK